MRLIIFCCSLLVLTVKALRFEFNEHNMPIKIVETSTGAGGWNRIEFIEALIHPHHLKSRGRVNFPTKGEIQTYYSAIRAHGDERGHLIASMFSGPPKWYNLSPQSPVVNRNMHAQAITVDWYNTECEAKQWLQSRGHHRVHWIVNMEFEGDSNRPSFYHLRVRFLPGIAEVDTRIRNVFLQEIDSFVVCRTCHSRRCTRVH